jgi:hypothetical protein
MLPAWAYFVIGTVIVLLVLLTFRRNSAVTHSAGSGYGVDFGRVLEDVAPLMDQLRDAVRHGEVRPVAMAAARARSRVHSAISDLDRLNFPSGLSDEETEMLERLRLSLRQAMENYEWAARIAETTDLVENQGLRRGFDTLVSAGDQLAVDSRMELAGLSPSPPS